ncbi:unnamed protein product [Rhizophagus irregularis]|nr:unnamed protein product [Rhizophagus irregularis]
MEYSDSETSDYSSNSKSSLFTGESTNHKKDVTIRKIAELRKKIAELEDSAVMKEGKKNKVKKGPLNQCQPQIVEDNSFDNMTVNKTKRSSDQSQLPIIEDESFNNHNPKGSSEDNDTEFSSDEPEQPIFKKKNINYQKIPSFLHIPKRIWHGYMESMRLIVAEKLYHLCSTIEYRDMPIIEINKCIDKFRKKNPSFPETVSDWAEREMIRRHINYRRSILNLNEMHKTNISVNKAKIRKPNGNSKRAKKGNELLTKNREPLLVSNSPNIESLERLDNNKSLPKLLEAVDVSPAYSKRPGHKHKITQSSDKEEAIEDVETIRIPPAKRPGRKTKAAQPPDDEKGVEDVEVVRIPPAKRPGRKRKITQPSDDEKGVEDVETIRIPPAKRPGRKTKATQPPDDEKGVEDVETIRIPPAKCPGRKCKITQPYD